jgi:hypothetical protein
VLIHLWRYLAGTGIVSALIAVVFFLLRRYRRSAGRELQPFLGYVVSSLRLMFRRRLSPVLARRFGVRAYADVTLAEFTRRLPIPSRGRSSVDIERAYIRLSLTASPERRIDDEALLSGEAGSVLIFGEPGSGKSSLTRKLYREELKQAYLQPFRSRLPLHVELGKLSWDEVPDERDPAVDWLRGILRSAVGRVKRVNDPQFVFDAFAAGPGLVLFLDGLDEVPSDKLRVAEFLIGNTIKALRHESSGTSIIVTARTQLRSSLTRGFVDDFGEVFTVTPFTPADVFAFLRRWDFPPAKRLTETQRIFEHLRRNVTLFAMCTNPLVLAMYVAEDELHVNESGSTVRLPDTRVKFYDQVVGELLYFRREDQRSATEPVGTQLLITRQELLGRIALDHLLESSDPANVISLTRSARIAQKYWSTANTDQAARNLIQLAVETGLVTVQQEGHSLQFIHLSICEYLAGKELAERDEEQLRAVLERVATDSPEARRLWETVVFAVALSKRDPRERALRRLTEIGAPSELILRIVREVQSYDLKEFHQAVVAATVEISSQPVEEWDADWIGRVRLILSCLADSHRLTAVRPQEGLPTVAGWLDDLVESDGMRFDRVFDLYIAASPAEALRVAGEVEARAHFLADRERMVLAMEHPDLIALAMKMIMEGAADADDWIDVLADAALRFELVAQTLFEEAIPAHLATLTKDVGKRYAWHRKSPIADTFYGAIMAVATSRDRPSVPGSPARLVRRVDLISQVRPRNSFLDPFLRMMMWTVVGPVGFLPIGILLDRPDLLLVSTGLTGLLFFVRTTGSRTRGNVVRFCTMPQLLGLESVHHDGGVPVVFVTRFGDGLVRLYLAHDDVNLLTYVSIAEVRRSLVSWSLTVCDVNGQSLELREPIEVVNLSNQPAHIQVINVFRKSGTMICVTLKPRFTWGLFRPLPPRKAAIREGADRRA